MKGLTKRQKEVLDFVREFILKNGYSPSFNEIKEHLQLKSLSTVFKHVSALSKKGHLNGEPKAKRSLYPTNDMGASKKEPLLHLPLIGKLSIGEKIETYPKTTTLAVPGWMLSSGAENVYLIKNETDSDEEYLQEGDYLLVEARNEPIDGERVLALLHAHEPIIRTFYHKEGFISLESRHAGAYPLIVREEDLSIQGIVLGLIRI